MLWCQAFVSSSFIPLSVLKSANRRKSLLLFAMSMLTMSGGLFWLAAKSCRKRGEQERDVKITVQNHNDPKETLKNK